MTVEDFLYHAHYIGIEEQIHSLEKQLRREEPYAETRHLLEKAYNQIIHNMTAEGTLETLSWEGSSMIKSTTYNLEKEILLVEFANGAEYSYNNISKKEYTEFKDAESKGQHFIKNIRNQKTYEKHEAQKN